MVPVTIAGAPLNDAGVGHTRVRLFIKCAKVIEAKICYVKRIRHRPQMPAI